MRTFLLSLNEILGFSFGAGASTQKELNTETPLSKNYSTDKEGILQITSYIANNDGAAFNTHTIRIEGKMVGSDEWATLETVNAADVFDLDLAFSPQTITRSVEIMPIMRATLNAPPTIGSKVVLGVY